MQRLLWVKVTRLRPALSLSNNFVRLFQENTDHTGIFRCAERWAEISGFKQSIL